MMLEELREQVWQANVALPKEGLVTWTSGNVSGRDPETNLMVIKPSGVLFDDLTPDDLVVVDMDGNVVEGEHGPSSDTATHLWIYRNRPDVHGDCAYPFQLRDGICGGQQAHSGRADGHCR